LWGLKPTPDRLPGAAACPFRAGISPIAGLAGILVGALVVCGGTFFPAALAQDAPGLRPVIDPAESNTETIPDTVPRTRSRTAPNYGRPRPLADKRLLYPGRRKEARKPLTRLEPYLTSPRSIRDRDPLSGPPPVQYAEPQRIPRKRRPRIEDDPYAPLGINMGAMRVLPFVEFSGGYDTNAGQAATGAKGSSLARIDAGFRAFSLWSRHEFTMDVRGGYAK
jgi:hypothetical protein